MQKNKTKKKEPLKEVELKITDENGVTGDLSLVSIVRSPATDQHFLMFSKEKKHRFTSVDNEQQLITGIVMRPELRIIREAEDGSFYNVFFSKETVRECAMLFAKNNIGNMTSLEHGEVATKNQLMDEAFCIETWIVEDPNCDKTTALNIESVEGDWAATYKIVSPKLWSIIKTDGFNGYSIEGTFVERMFAKNFSTEDPIEQRIKEIIYNETLMDEEKETLIKSFFAKKHNLSI